MTFAHLSDADRRARVSALVQLRGAIAHQANSLSIITAGMSDAYLNQAHDRDTLAQLNRHAAGVAAVLGELIEAERRVTGAAS